MGQLCDRLLYNCDFFVYICAMLKTINSKFIVFTIIFIILSVGIPTMFLLSQFQANFHQRSIVMLQSTIDVVNSCLRNAMLLGRQKHLPTILENISNNEGVDHIRIFGKDGKIHFSANSAEVGRNIYKIAPGHVSAQLTEDRQTFINEVDRTYSVTSAIINEKICKDCHTDDGNIIAYVDVDTDLTQAEVNFETGSVHMSFLAAAIILILFIGFYLIFNHFINKPLGRFKKALDEVDKGNLNVQLPAKKSDEIGVLEGHFNTMVSNLQTSNQKIDEMHFEQLQRADKLVTLGELAAEMAHEINNPAGIIMTRADYIQMGISDNPDLKKYDEDLDVVINQVNKISKITGSMLKYSKKLPKEFDEVNLELITEESLTVLGPRLAKNNIQVERHFKSDQPLILADPIQMEQVCTNLVNNAVDAMEKDGNLTIGIEDIDSKHILWTIKDNGVGMGEDTREQIFNPFFTTKDANKGTGLGLYIVKNICKNHNAEIECISQPKNGTIFNIIFHKIIK